MSKIANKLIEQKLKEVLDGQENVDYSKFDDNTALLVIFSTLEDRATFADLIAERYIKEIVELKAVQQQTKKILKLSNERQNASASQKFILDEVEKKDQSARKDDQQKIKKLQQTCESQKEELKRFENEIILLEQKILQNTEKLSQVNKKCFELNLQLQFQITNDKENKKKIQQILLEKETIIKSHEESIKKYQDEFVQNLVQTLKTKHDSENVQSRNLNQKLQKEKKNLQKIVNKVVQAVSQVFRIDFPRSPSEQIDDWMETLKKKVDKYRRQIITAVNLDIKEVEDPIKVLTDLMIRKIQFRNLILSAYLNK